MKQVIVHKGRTVVLPVSLGFDVSEDTITSEIREGKSHTSDLIGTWVVTYVTDGTDGEVILTLDDSVTAGITQATGFMDIKRITGGEPVSVFDEPLEVLFEDVITA